MKKVFLFCSRLWVYLTELPVIALLWVTVSYNEKSDAVFKFYPLIVFLSAAIVFIFIYFFRVISVSTDEIRFHGLFSSKDSAFITEGKTLKMEIRRRKGIKLYLYEDAGLEPAFDWMKAEDVVHRELCVFRGRAIGGPVSAGRIISLFGAPREYLKDVTNDGFEFINDTVSVTTVNDGEVATVSVKFLKTIV